jgi:hypothetical protein
MSAPAEPFALHWSLAERNEAELLEELASQLQRIRTEPNLSIGAPEMFASVRIVEQSLRQLAAAKRATATLLDAREEARCERCTLSSCICRGERT